MAMMTPWSQATEREHDYDPQGLCQYVSRDNMICWEVATGLFYKSLGVRHVCQEHNDLMAKEASERHARNGRILSLSTRWAPDGGERQGQDER